jgi:hypothetical protein
MLKAAAVLFPCALALIAAQGAEQATADKLEFEVASVKPNRTHTDWKRT